MPVPALIHLAQVGDAASGGSPFAMPLILGALFLLFYALLIRPQRQQEKAQKEMRDALKRGDQVVTTGGIHGKITAVEEEVVTVEIADKVRVRVSRSAVVGKAGTPAAKSENAAKSEPAKGEVVKEEAKK